MIPVSSKLSSPSRKDTRMKSSADYWTKLEERTSMSRKLNEIIEEALKGFFKVERRAISPGINKNFVATENLMLARSFLEGWGIEYEYLYDERINAPILESLRLKMKGKICVDAPDWFRRCDPEEVPPTILYIPEKLALKMLALGYLPSPEKASA